jgi:hypothetical protein
MYRTLDVTIAMGYPSKRKTASDALTIPPITWKDLILWPAAVVEVYQARMNVGMAFEWVL